MYNNGNELLALISAETPAISDVVLANESRLLEQPPNSILERTRKILRVMKDSATMALEKDIRSVSGFTGGDAKRMKLYTDSGNTISGSRITAAMAKAFSSSEVNASMGKVVAAPTAGSCGIVPAALISTEEHFLSQGLSSEEVEKKIIRGLLTAAGIGQIIAKNATLSGAEGGCQAECGAAAAMAAAALVEMYGGTPEMAFNAAGISIMNILGLVCDPVAGLVELPCAKRNASGVVNAMISADMGLAGVESVIPFDEIVEAMYRVGKALPATLRETAMGGLATTPTGKRMSCQLYGQESQN